MKRKKEKMPKPAPPAPPTEIISVSDIYPYLETPDGKKQIKKLANKKIYESLIDQIIELGLVPTAETGEFSIELLNSKSQFMKYLQPLSTENLAWCYWEVRPIFRSKGDIKTIDILENEEKRIVENLANSIKEDELTLFLEKLKRDMPDAVHEFQGKSNPTLKGWVAWYYFCSLHAPEANYSFLNLPLSRNHVTNSRMCVHSSNTYLALLWEYIDLTHELLIPSQEMFEKKGRYLKELKLQPKDSGIVYRIRNLSAYSDKAQVLIEQGVSERVFRAVLRYYTRKMERDWYTKLSRLDLHFFMLAFFLKKDHLNLYKFYLRQIKDFIFKVLEADKIEELKNKLAKAQKEKKFNKGFYLPGGLKNTESDISQIEEKIKRENLKRDVQINQFKILLEKDVFLVSVFYWYVFNGEKILEIKLPPKRPPKEVIGKIVTYLDKKLKKAGITHRDRMSGWLLYALTGDSELLWQKPLVDGEQKNKKPIKGIRHNYKRKGVKKVKRS